MTSPIDTNTRGGDKDVNETRNTVDGAPRWGGAIRGKVKVKMVNSGLAWILGATAMAAGGITYSNYDDPGQDPEVGYVDNLQMLRSQTGRNTNHDSSAYRDVKASEIVQANHLGPRADYLNSANGNPEQAFPVDGGGQFRTACEFSHFMYDDPVVLPDEPGGSHLHMVFGNTDINARTTQETLEDSGSGTCNGQELNRSGYWVPAMIDGDGMVRIPERIVVYYKAEGLSNGTPNGDDPLFPDGTPNPGAQQYERGMRNLAPMGQTVPETPGFDGGAPGEVNFKCTSNFSGFQFADGVNNIPNCDGDHFQNNFGAPYPATRTVLEMEVKFWTCFPEYDESNPNAAANPDVTDYTLWQPAGPTRGGWFFNNCTGRGGQSAGAPALDDKETYPNFSYFVNYVVEPGDDTSDWFLASDVDVSTIGSANPSLVAGGAGSSSHGDVWWSWDEKTQDDFFDNCINFSLRPVLSGCGFGYLSNGGPNGSAPLPGPALNYRPDYDVVGDGSTYKTSLQTLFNEICVPLGPAHAYSQPEHGAVCKT